MHDIEPHFNWRDRYIASEDKLSPFFGKQHSEFYFTNKIYNYYIHPQWDFFGSATLYMKVLFTDYDDGYTIIELIGEWNDCLHNDVMFLKRDIVDDMLKKGISKFIFICENVLNFHAGDDDYYEEWYEDVRDERGWIVFLNTLEHVEQEMKDARLQAYINFSGHFSSVIWRPHKPKNVFKAIEALVEGEVPKYLY